MIAEANEVRITAVWLQLPAQTTDGSWYVKSPICFQDAGDLYKTLGLVAFAKSGTWSRYCSHAACHDSRNPDDSKENELNYQAEP